MSTRDEETRPPATTQPSDTTDHHSTQEELLAVVADKAARKLEARQTQHRNVWFGLGMFGMVGWSIVVPTLLGLALGIWLDRRLPVVFSWTITLLFAGIVLGCLNAWFWVTRERERIERRLHTTVAMPEQDDDVTREEPMS